MDITCLLWIPSIFISFIVSDIPVAIAVKVLSKETSSLTHDLPEFPDSMTKNSLEMKTSSGMCYVDRAPPAPTITNVGQVFQRELPGVGRRIDISQYDVQSRATLQNKLQFWIDGKWNTVWDAIDFGEAPFLPMNFPTQSFPGNWRWELTCVANCKNAKIHSLNTDYCFRNTSRSRHLPKYTDEMPDARSFIGGSAKVGCYHKEAPSPIAMNHMGAEHILSLDGEGSHIRIMQYSLSVNSTIHHKLQFWNGGWKTLWSGTAFGYAPKLPPYIAVQNRTGSWRWDLTCVSHCTGQLRGLRTEYCLPQTSGSLISVSRSVRNN